jgi:hypothetical protein
MAGRHADLRDRFAHRRGGALVSTSRFPYLTHFLS